MFGFMTPLHLKLCRLEQLNVAQSPNSLVDVSREEERFEQ